jgi:hypothetical protein
VGVTVAFGDFTEKPEKNWPLARVFIGDSAINSIAND